MQEPFLAVRTFICSVAMFLLMPAYLDVTIRKDYEMVNFFGQVQPSIAKATAVAVKAELAIIYTALARVKLTVRASFLAYSASVV